MWNHFLNYVLCWVWMYPIQVCPSKYVCRSTTSVSINKIFVNKHIHTKWNLQKSKISSKWKLYFFLENRLLLRTSGTFTVTHSPIWISTTHVTEREKSRNHIFIEYFSTRTKWTHDVCSVLGLTRSRTTSVNDIRKYGKSSKKNKNMNRM